VRQGQRAYAEKLLERGGELQASRDSNGRAAQAVKAQHRSKGGHDYRSIVSGLRYLTHTRSDISFAVGYFSRFMEDPREDHWMAVKRLLRYVKGTLDQAIIFPKHGGKGGPPKTEEGEPELTVFSDADMADNIDG
jgi:hypothetical protein